MYFNSILPSTLGSGRPPSNENFWVHTCVRACGTKKFRRHVNVYYNISRNGLMSLVRKIEETVSVLDYLNVSEQYASDDSDEGHLCASRRAG
jgi:hypothetical protein